MCVDVIEAVSVRVKLGFVADAVAVFVKVGESVLVTELDEVRVKVTDGVSVLVSVNVLVSVSVVVTDADELSVSVIVVLFDGDSVEVTVSDVVSVVVGDIETVLDGVPVFTHVGKLPQA